VVRLLIEFEQNFKNKSVLAFSYFTFYKIIPAPEFCDIHVLALLRLTPQWFARLLLSLTVENWILSNFIEIIRLVQKVKERDLVRHGLADIY
jgi:hypothetical protein